MASKRNYSLANGGGGESPTRAGGSNRRCCGRHDQEDTLHEIMKKLDSEPKLVQQLCQWYQSYVHHLSSRCCRTCTCRLQFRNKLPKTLFTDRKLITENDMKVEIVIVDALNKVIKSGPMATAKIEIVVLDGDFDGDENGEWTEEEFEKNVKVARKDKGPLLVGDSLLIKLCDGVGYISDAKFTDNSSWTRSKNFKLGVKLHERIGMAGEVQEGISNAFRVKDRHGERNQKGRHLLMTDKVYCLKGISKDGKLHKELIKFHIDTVWDFLNWYDKEPEKLREIIKMPPRTWEKTRDHALESRNGLISFPLPSQNYEFTGSSSSQISNVSEQPNDVYHLPSNAECEIPISVMSASAQSLLTPIIDFGPRNSFKEITINREGVWEGTEQIDMSLDILMEGISRSYVPNKFNIGSLSPCKKWLKILFMARLKVAALRARESKYAETSSPRHNDDHSFNLSEQQWEHFSPIFSFNSNEMDDMNY